ncbi:chromogranin-A isoform X2 [Rana temporaria]|uniref:chromogranin-A isoform X2 n=1 Tax=Rana temporaria TaxID=8407 RepID=UPI001AACA0F6|nr:chromogranin-A isoform X2 [Rana temporaria]
MLSVGVLSLALCVAQVLSLPVSSLEGEDNTKVMKCIVEVISDTLSKPNPVPITQDCLDTLRGDERIISILRHQNLLKELQELASQGAVERLQKAKKNRGYEEELSGVLEKQEDKAPVSEKSDEFPLHGEFSESEEEAKRQPEEERKASSERSREGDSGEELESNEISKREETPEDEEEIDNHITDEINDMELPKDNQEDAGDGGSEEKEAASKKDPEDEEIGDHEKEDLKQESNETENEEDETQREDNSMRTPEETRSEVETSKESKQQESETTDCSDDETTKDLEDSKRWNKMDELAKELRAKRCAKRDASEEDPDRSMKIPTKDQKYEPASEEREERQRQQTSREDMETPMSKRPEERKEEEGSANRKTEVGVRTSERSQ